MQIFSEQKQMAKEGLTQERFAAYASVIEQETNDYIKKAGQALATAAPAKVQVALR